MTRASRTAERPPTWRKPLIIGVVVLLAIAAGAAIALAMAGSGGTASGSPSPSPSATPDASETPEPGETPDPMATPTAAPPESPEQTDDPSPTPDGDLALIAPWQSVRVTVNGLAVRRGPGTQYDLVSDYRYDDETNTEVLETDEVRLDEGHFLWVEDGPLVIDGVPWYRVYDSLPQTEPRDDIGRWDADGDEFLTDAGWVAGGSGSNAYLVLETGPEPSGPIFGEGLDPYAITFGTGDGRTDSFDFGLPVSARWAAAAPEGGSCSIVIRLVPADIEIVSMEVDEWAFGDDFWPKDMITGPTGEHWLEVETDCTWSLRAFRVQG